MCLFLFSMLIVPSIMQQRETQRKVACQERMQALGAGLSSSAEMNNDRFPPLVKEGLPWTVGILGIIEQQ